MAIFHCSIKIITRSAKTSAVASSAYRSGEKIENERDGRTHDYTAKQGVVAGGIIAPEHCPEWVQDRSKLWNSIEKMEKKGNAQVAREIEIALPKELTLEQQKGYVQEFCKPLVAKGLIADWNIHDKSDGNPHVHIMLTMRRMDENGEWMNKSKMEYVLNENGEKQRLKSGQWKSNKVYLTDWDDQENAEIWRKNAADIGNKFLKKIGVEAILDHRSNERRGIEDKPTIHLGPVDSAKERRGERTERGDINRFILEQNKTLENIDKVIADIQTVKAEQLATPPAQQYKVGDVYHIIKRRESRLRQLSENLMKQKIQNTEQEMKLTQPEHKEVAEEHFTKVYASDFKENQADIQRYNADVAKYEKKWFKSDSEHEALNARKIAIDNQQIRLKENYARDVAMAVKGLYEDRGVGTIDSTATQKLISTRAEAIAIKRDPQIVSKKQAFTDVWKELNKSSLIIDAEISDCQKVLKSIKNVNHERKLNLPIVAINNKQTSIPVSINGGGIVNGIIGILNRQSKDVAALNAKTADEDLSCLEGEALHEAIKARGDSGVGIE